MKEGDYIFMEFGHNDQKEKRPGSGAFYNYAYALKLGSAAGSASAFNDGLAPGEQIWEVYHNCFED